MTIFKCQLKSLSDLIKLVTYTNTKTNIHVIHCEDYYIDASHHRRYFIYYGGGKEYYYCQDPVDGLNEGLFAIDLNDGIDTGKARRIEKLTSEQYNTSDIYVFIIGARKIEYVS